MYAYSAIAFLASLVSTAVAGPLLKPREAISITPHIQYSSSVGVIGCKINTNRVAYWPSPVDCNKICVKVTANGRSVHLLKIDESNGAFDISYDAWNYLLMGKPAKEDPQEGGDIDAEYEFVDGDECKNLLISGGKLPFTAANSMNFISSCGPDTWVGKNHELLNIHDPVCHNGYDEVCRLEPPNNQPSCPHTLGITEPLKGLKVINIEFGTGKESVA